MSTLRRIGPEVDVIRGVVYMYILSCTSVRKPDKGEGVKDPGKFALDVIYVWSTRSSSTGQDEEALHSQGEGEAAVQHIKSQARCH